MPTAGRRVLERVHQEIGQNLDQAIAIGGHRGQRRCHLRGQLDVAFVGHRGDAGERIFHEPFDGDVAVVPFDTAGFDLGQVEKLVQQAGEALAFDENRVAEARHDVGLGHVVLHDDLRCRDHRGERCADLVRDFGEKLGLEIVDFAESCVGDLELGSPALERGMARRELLVRTARIEGRLAEIHLVAPTLEGAARVADRPTNALRVQCGLQKMTAACGATEAAGRERVGVVGDDDDGQRRAHLGDQREERAVGIAGGVVGHERRLRSRLALASELAELGDVAHLDDRHVGVSGIDAARSVGDRRRFSRYRAREKSWSGFGPWFSPSGAVQIRAACSASRAVAPASATRVPPPPRAAPAAIARVAGRADGFRDVTFLPIAVRSVDRVNGRRAARRGRHHARSQSATRTAQAVGRRGIECSQSESSARSAAISASG